MNVDDDVVVVDAVVVVVVVAAAVMREALRSPLDPALYDIKYIKI